MVMSSDPVLAEVWRGDFLECLHHGALVVTAPDGSVRFAAGDVDGQFLPRSSIKPIQAIAMLRHGLDVDGADLALSGASHSGEPFHLEAVRGMLDGAGLSPDDLQNTPGLPLDTEAQAAYLADGHGKSPLAHNCSGKHAAMLRTCVRAGWSRESYLDPDHPLHVAARTELAELSGEDIPEPVVDGCGAPAFAVSPTGLARAFGRIAAAEDGPAKQVADAFGTFPQYASGTRRDELVLHHEVPGLICKLGAEGCLAVGLADGSGIVVKVGDGHHRGTIPPLVAALTTLGLGTPALAALDPEPVLGHGRPAGRVVVDAWLATRLGEVLG